MVQHYTWGFSPQCTSNCVNQWNEQAAQDVTYFYDYPVSSDYAQSNTWGRLTGVAFSAQTSTNQPAFAYEYSYNQAGRVTGNRMLVKEAPGSPGLDLQAQYAWDTQGRMTSMTYPSGAAMTYGFDAMGRPITMTQMVGSQSLQAGSATYGSAGQVLSFGGAASTGTWRGAYAGNIPLGGVCCRAPVSVSPDARCVAWIPWGASGSDFARDVTSLSVMTAPARVSPLKLRFNPRRRDLGNVTLAISPSAKRSLLPCSPSTALNFTTGIAAS